ncbi:hypothetical protein RIF29_09159 [Crotalaria pallida]|uniref:DUF1677 family protein n=1 Tax=Crotalaria pallida TaxID=3830 RepID=A0AAN9ILL8_CROPI
MTIPGSESHPHTAKSVPVPQPQSPQVEVECVKCDSCGFSEECTPAYISRLRNRYHGRWLCGICVEAVKNEVLKSEKLITTEEAVNRHIKLCSEFRSSTALKQAEHPISAMGRVLRRSLNSPRRPLRSNSIAALSPLDEVRTQPPLTRSESCFPSISR